MRRFAEKRDENEKDIVTALERIGFMVYRKLPCDLLTFRETRCPHCHGNQWKTLEVKMPTARPRKDQAAQTEFLNCTGTPIVRTAEQALIAVGAIVQQFGDRREAAF